MSLEVEVQMQNTSVEGTLETSLVTELPLLCHDPEGDVLVWWPSEEPQDLGLRRTIVLKLEGGSDRLVNEIRVEDVELVSLHDLGGWVIRIVVSLVVLVPLVASMHTVEVPRLAWLVFVFPGIVLFAQLDLVLEDLLVVIHPLVALVLQEGRLSACNRRLPLGHLRGCHRRGSSSHWVLLIWNLLLWCLGCLLNDRADTSLLLLLGLGMLLSLGLIGPCRGLGHHDISGPLGLHGVQPALQDLLMDLVEPGLGLCNDKTLEDVFVEVNIISVIQTLLHLVLLLLQVVQALALEALFQFLRHSRVYTLAVRHSSPGRVPSGSLQLVIADGGHGLPKGAILIIESSVHRDVLLKLLKLVEIQAPEQLVGFLHLHVCVV
mmetsp:Transcript_13382/g.20933  ORF Transcript_13382/g.20933 Transcript_13382/m.20933 type:complete len:376 (-) Transcript_13382:265-1392(-)